MAIYEESAGVGRDAADSAIDVQFKVLAERVAKTADADLKGFLSGILSATEATLTDLKSMRERLHKVQADSDAAAEAVQKFRRDANDTAARAELKAAAAAAGAVDAEDVLPFLNLNEVKLDKDGKSNILELIGGLKKAKPHLFSKVNTSATHPVPKPGNAAPRNALDMSVGEYRAAKARFTRR